MHQVPESIIKAAKKALKKEEEGMSLETLTKKVNSKIKDIETSVTVEQLQTWLDGHKKFNVDAASKNVNLKKKKEKKRAVTPCGTSSNDEQPKSKKSKTSSTGSNEVDTWRKENKIVVLPPSGENNSNMISAAEEKQFTPFCTFDDCKQHIAKSLIDQCVQGNGFVKPSPIQAQAWPILAAKRDVVGIAETGSGKTLAFCLPALTAMSLSSSKTRKQPPRMLVLAPTRELAMQSEKVLSEFGAVVGLQSLVVYGGVPKQTQTMALKKSAVDCLVATPGRIKDLINDGVCDLSQIQYLVLDEADRMLDMGFEEDVRFIIKECPGQENRQTAMFSATWPLAIQQIAMEFMKNPVRIYVGMDSDSNKKDGTEETSLSANKRVKQIVQVIEDRAREARLRAILREEMQKNKNRVIIFALYKKEAERLEFSLKKEGWSCCSIHGNKNQAARTKALDEFKDGTAQALIATDVASRGLDLPSVGVVINYTFPLTIEDYVHRIGRTGRAGKMGVSYTFFQPSDKAHAGELQQVMRQAGQDIPEELMKFGSTIKKKEHKLYGNFGPRNGQPMKQATKIRFDQSDEE